MGACFTVGKTQFNKNESEGISLLNKAWVRRTILMLMDAAVVVLAFYIGIVLRFSIESSVAHERWLSYWTAAPLLVLVQLTLYYVGGVYDVVWRLADVEDVLRMFVLAILAVLADVIAVRLLKWGTPLSVILFTVAIASVASVIARILWRMLRGGRLQWRKASGETRSVMVVGAGEAGAYVIARYLEGLKRDGMNIRAILVDDDEAKQGRNVHGVRVYGKLADIDRLVKVRDVQEIIIAIPSLQGQAHTDLVTRCKDTGARVRVVSNPKRLREGKDDRPQLRELTISDFLSREQVVLDTEGISGYLTGKVVLVSGGGGSIGSEICRQVMRFAPKELIIFDIYENDAYALLTELCRLYGPDCPVRVRIGSIRDVRRLSQVFAAFKPQVVFHAAAHKHVSLMEESPGEAIKNNIFGTMNLLDVSNWHGVERFVQLSTDKAVNPSCVMGATKRVAEMLNQLYAGTTKMKCMVVRFGNVLGSHGSVIPLFEAQIKAGGPVTVTDREVTRYFMTIMEAAQLVLQAGGLAESGATYVLEMGNPVKIIDLAHQLIRFYGYEPEVDIPITFTGLREGEKLHEELLTEAEQGKLRHTAHQKIMIAPPINIDEDTFYDAIEGLRVQCAEGDDMGITASLMGFVE